MRHTVVPGERLERTQRGWSGLTKIAWRPAARHQLGLDYVSVPREYEGLFLGFGVSPEADGMWRQHGRTVQARRTWTPSSRLAPDAHASWLDAGLDVTPVSDLFHRNRAHTISRQIGGPVSVQALYPQRECSDSGDPNRFVPKRDPAPGEMSVSHVDLVTGLTSGPLSFRIDDARTRKAIRADLGCEPKAGGGDHEVRLGFEADREEYEDDAIYNPILYDRTAPCPACRDALGRPIPNAVTGVQQLIVPTPTAPHIQVEGTESSFWLSDSWRVGRGLVFQAGVRLDRESVNGGGFTPFDPSVERRRFISIVDTLCAEPFRIARAGGTSNANLACGPGAGFRPGGPPVVNLVFQMDANTPASVRKYDTDGDGSYDTGTDGPVWSDALMTFAQRLAEPFRVTNINLSPRLGLSRDPWSRVVGEAGKTKPFATWGRCHDRLLLAPIAYEAEPPVLGFTFEPDPARHLFAPGDRSRPAPATSVTQVERGLRTPRTV